MEKTLMLERIEGIGSMGLSILELYSFLKQPSTPTIAQWLSGFLMTLLHVSENKTVFRAGLVYSDHVTLEHHSYFIWLLLLLFFTGRSKPSHLSHQQCSHVNTLIQDLVFARLILKSQDYYILGLCYTFMTCFMLFKETGFHHQIHKMQQ